ncbi:MAG TPA: hypothetical protein VMS56_14045 [Thermoanaerobaculia bacterium]|nr:hypothetical protein [Thermoanaerobaculia bacterium]
MSEWSARRILREIAGPSERQAILETFWEEAEEGARREAAAVLAKALRFREQTLRKAPLAKKAELLGSRIGSPDLEETFEIALMTWHTLKAGGLMAAFLDRWGVPHQGGLIEVEEYEVPAAARVQEAVDESGGRFPPRAVALYLASVGLLMGESRPEWREATWPVVDRMLPGAQ